MARKRRFSGEADLKPWLTNKAPGGKTNGRFIQVGNSLLMCKCFQDLSAGAKYLYFAMAMEAGAQNDFAFSKGIAARKYGIAATSFERHRRELEDAGFISLSRILCLILRQKRNLPQTAFASALRSGATERRPAISLRDVHR